MYALLESQIKCIFHSYTAIFYSPLRVNYFSYPPEDVHFSRNRRNGRLAHRVTCEHCTY